jgi:hypothetical protein
MMARMRAVTRVLLVLALAPASLVLLAGSASAVTGVIPVLACVSESSATSYTAHYGYVNTNGSQVVVVVGSSNFFEPGPGGAGPVSPFLGQPTDFLPGTVTEAFTTTPVDKGTSMQWTLLGFSAAASWTDSPRCGGSVTETITREPDLVGNPAVGETVTASGERAILNPLAYEDAFTWLRGCDEADPVEVGHDRSYPIGPDDAGHRIQAVIDRRDPDTGQGVTWHTACDAAALVGVKPAVASIPAVAGAAAVGSSLSLSGLVTAGTAPVTTSWTWQSCDTASCVDTGSGPTYAVTSSDVGRTIRAEVTATNGWGADRRTTAPSAVVRSPVSGTVSLGPGTMTFAAALGTTSTAQTATYANGTTAARRIAAVSVTGPGFVRTGGDCVARVVLGPGEACTVVVAFAPGVAGTAAGRLVVDDGTGEPGAVTLSGTATPPGEAALAPAALDFAATAGTTSAVQTVTYTNSSVLEKRITAVEVTGAGFVRSGGDCVARVVLAAGESCTVGVAFSPTTDGPATGELVVDDGAQHSIELTGTAAPGGRLGTSPRTVGFGTVARGGSSKPRTVAVRNTGTQELTVTGVSVAGPQRPDFAVTATSCRGAVLVPAARCTVTLVMSPHRAGPRAGTLVLLSTAPGADVVVSLRGRGR